MHIAELVYLIEVILFPSNERLLLKQPVIVFRGNLKQQAAPEELYLE